MPVRSKSIARLHFDIEHIPLERNDTTSREKSLRELTLARALYRCGDSDGLGESLLRQYAKDLRGHYA